MINSELISDATELDNLGDIADNRVGSALLYVAASATDFILTHNEETLDEEGRELLKDLQELKRALQASKIID